MCDPIACSNCDFWCGERGDVDCKRENGWKGEKCNGSGRRDPSHLACKPKLERSVPGGVLASCTLCRSLQVIQLCEGHV